MPIQTVDHIYVETRSFVRALGFWRGLGFEVAAQWGEDGHRACQLVARGARVVLAEAEADPCPPTVHFAVDAAESVQVALSANRAVDVVTPLQETHWGSRWIRVRDPDGNVYSLEEPRPAAHSQRE